MVIEAKLPILQILSRWTFLAAILFFPLYSFSYQEKNELLITVLKQHEVVLRRCGCQEKEISFVRLKRILIGGQLVALRNELEHFYYGYWVENKYKSCLVNIDSANTNTSLF